MVICIALLIFAISQLGIGKKHESALRSFSAQGSLNISDIYRARKNSICSISGYKNYVYVYENVVKIGSKSYNINDIESIYFSPSSITSRGYLQILAYGQSAVKSIGEAIKHDDILILQAVGQNEEANKLKQKITDLINANKHIKNKRLDEVANKYAFQVKNITGCGAVLTKTGIVYDLYDTVATFDEWDVKKSRFISYQDIDFFSMRGSLRQEMSVKGGGLNLGGAILGGVLFGGVGAILGGKAGTQISTTTETIDDRFVFVRSNKSTKDIVISVGRDIEETLIGLRKEIPDKEYIENGGFKTKSPNKSKTASDKKQLQASGSKTAKPKKKETVPDELRKYKELLDDGIITQEEFDTKKKQLLGL